MFELMIFMILFFIGIAAALFAVIFKIDGHYKRLSEENAELRVLMRAMESQINLLARDRAGVADSGDAAGPGAECAQGADSLLRLNFEKPIKPEEDFSPEGLELKLELSPKRE